MQSINLSGRIWFSVRRNGVKRKSGWISSTSLEKVRRRVGVHDDEIVEICIVEDITLVPFFSKSGVFINRARGILGLIISFKGQHKWHVPTSMIASNLSFDLALKKYLSQHKISNRDFRKNGELRSFSATQYLLPSSKVSPPVCLYRGSTLVSFDTLLWRDQVKKLALGIQRWMIKNQSSDGSLPYKYWPSRGQYSSANNAIRQFLATIALARFAKLERNATVGDAAKKNLHYNLSVYFQNIGDGRGAIVEKAGAKLGAAALAGISILENPDGNKFTAQLEMLMTTVKFLIDEKSGFQTFLFPLERNGQNWNFYSGEALLFLAEARRFKLNSAPTIKQMLSILEICKARHFANPNPAFVPWHTQACASLFLQTSWHQRKNLANYVFQMNDWLLSMQQWDSLKEDDLRGRFYNPRKSEFGPPHAASTGVYLEGLTDAATIAYKLGDLKRFNTYIEALRRGFRSLRQLQFRDWRDLYYISKRDRAKGALRTECYDNSVRIDSAAHALLAALKIMSKWYL